MSQLNQSCTSTALIGWGSDETCDMRMVSQQSRDRTSQGAGAVTVNDSHLTQAGERSLIEKLVDRIDRFVGCLSDDVQLRLDLLTGGRKMNFSSA